MKRTVGALAVLLLVTIVATGQQSPFPMAANSNPSPDVNTNPETVVVVVAQYRVDLPPSMAANTEEISVSVADWRYAHLRYEDWRYDADTESAFPTAANPSQATGTTTAELTPVVEQHHFDTESPFPIAASPLNNR